MRIIVHLGRLLLLSIPLIDLQLTAAAEPTSTFFYIPNAVILLSATSSSQTGSSEDVYINFQCSKQTGPRIDLQTSATNQEHEYAGRFEAGALEEIRGTNNVRIVLDGVELVNAPLSGQGSLERMKLNYVLRTEVASAILAGLAASHTLELWIAEPQGPHAVVDLTTFGRERELVAAACRGGTFDASQIPDRCFDGDSKYHACENLPAEAVWSPPRQP